MKPRPTWRGSHQGIALLDCLVYIGLLALLLGLAFSAYYETTRHTRRLNRNTIDIARALGAGERWRDDVRRCVATPRLETNGAAAVLALPHTNGLVRYTFGDETVLRQAASDTNWIEVLPNVAHASVHRDDRYRLVTWRWEVELQSQRGKRQLAPVFTFQAVAGGGKGTP